MSTPPDDRVRLAAGARGSALWMIVLVSTVLVAPAVLRGAALVDALRLWTFLLAYIGVPGLVVHRRLRPAVEDRLCAAGMAWALGYCLEALAYLCFKALGVAHLFAIYPAVVIAVALAWRAAPSDPFDAHGAPRARSAELCSFALLIMFVACRTPFHPSSEWWKVMNEDLLFHAGNAAELRNNWPMQDPRCAGQPLVYHFFSYALPASASAITGLSIGDVMYGVGAWVSPMMLALQLYNAGRIYGQSHLAGVIASALVMLHVDCGRAIAFALERAGLDGGAGVRWSFNSYLHVGVYGSTSTASGLMLFATLAILLARWYAPERRSSTRTAVLMACTGGVASGVKGSIMPVLIAGLGLYFVWRLVRTRAWDSRTLDALILLTLVSLPMMIFLSSGEETFVASMFHIEPGAAIRDSDSFIAALAFVGHAAEAPSPWLFVLALPIWLAGYLDLIGAGAVLYWLREHKRMQPAPAVLCASAVTGIVAALVYVASDLSQLFFLYTAQVGLAVLAGAALATFASPRTQRERIVTVALCVAAVPLLAGALHAAWKEVRGGPARPPPTVLAYSAGLDWMRANLPADAVVVAAHPGILVSAFGERRAFYETDRFTPAGHAAGWSRRHGHWEHDLAPGKAHPEYAALGNQVCSAAPGVAIEHVQRLLAPGVRLYVLCDDVRYETHDPAYGGPARADRAPGQTYFEIAPRAALDPSILPPRWTSSFANDVMHVYRVDPPRAP